MDKPSREEHQKDIAQLKQQLHSLHQSVDEMENLLDRYIASEEALHQSEEQFRLLVTGVREYAIFMLDTQGYIISWNTGAQLIKGYQADEIIGHHFSAFYPPADVATEKPTWALQVARRDGVYKEEGWRMRKDGSLFWASVVITALYDASGGLRGFAKVTRDLTERKQAEETERQLREQEVRLMQERIAREQAEAHVQLRDTFVSATAHDLRTPVTALLGYAQLIQRRLSHGDVTVERLQRPVQAMVLQAQRLNRLTTILLDISRLEKGKLVLERTPIDIRGSIEQVSRELQLITDDHAIIIDLPASPLKVETDQMRFEQVIYNLVQNGIKYSPAGTVVTVTAQQEGQYALISIEDQGIGIPADDIPHIFERFYRATNISRNNFAGLGLGLYFVKEFIEMQGGSVEVHSVLSKGTTFRITLPLVSEAHGS